MKTNVSKVGLRPYDDGSGFREEIIATWQRDTNGEDVVKHVEIIQGSDRLVVLLDDWPALSKAIDRAITEVKV